MARETRRMLEVQVLTTGVAADDHGLQSFAIELVHEDVSFMLALNDQQFRKLAYGVQRYERELTKRNLTN